MTKALALTLDIGEQIKTVPFWPAEGLAGLINKLIGVAIILAATVAFVFLVYGGIRWITSAGDKEQLASAQNTITNALIGLIIIFGAWAIMNLVKYFFGITGAPIGPTQTKCGADFCAVNQPCGGDVNGCGPDRICHPWWFEAENRCAYSCISSNLCH